MITLKIITTNIDGEQETMILSGDSISHREYTSKDHLLVKNALVKNSSLWCIGELVGISGDQDFIASDVIIYDEERECKNILLILPKSDCYIMDNGKTVDSFYTYYKY